MSDVINVMLVAPKSTGGNFEYVAIPRQGLLYLSGARLGELGDAISVTINDFKGRLDTLSASRQPEASV